MTTRFTKIVATLGPATNSVEAVRALVDAGVDVFRLNFSHGVHADHLKHSQRIRAVEAEVGRSLTMLADLQGPKLRIGTFANGVIELGVGDTFQLDSNPAAGDRQRAHLPHPEVMAALTEGTILLLDDGRIRLRVVQASSTRAETVVEAGGRLSDRKGLNLPNATLQASVLTPKDREDLAFAMALGVDWVALSFVQSAADVLELRELVQDRAFIIAKIEKPQAIAALDEIADAADALMVARGDLAVEMSTEEVPILQRRIVRACRLRGKPVVVATQMLESMTTAPVPTRAEAADVAAAVYQGVDAVMLSAETASGDHPLPAVQIMDRIIRRVEADPNHRISIAAQAEPAANERSDVIGAALRTASESTTLAATVTYTTSGASALKVARERPRSPLVAVTPSTQVARRLGLAWGMRPWVSEQAHGADELVQVAIRAARQCVAGASRGNVAIVAGLPFGTLGAINFLHIVPAEGAGD
jgi:pyruvate kinase